MAGDGSPTLRWIAAAPFLPPLHGPALTAERLLLLLHYGIDWDNGWVDNRRRGRYWEHHLPDRVRIATYRSGADLDRWWTLISEQLESSPSTTQRKELIVLLREPAKPVLTVLRQSTTALVLRTQTIAFAVREQRAATKEGLRG